jgi:hypothetical protein
VPGGRDGFRGRKGYDSGVVDRLAESPCVPDYDGHDEERAGEVSPKRDEPVQQHFPGREPAVASGDCRELFTGDARSPSATWVSNVASHQCQPTMKLPVHKSVPVVKIATRPHGKIIAPSKVIMPGAFSWYQGETETKSCSSDTRLLSAPWTLRLASHCWNPLCTRMRKPVGILPRRSS